MGLEDYKIIAKLILMTIHSTLPPLLPLEHEISGLSGCDLPWVVQMMTEDDDDSDLIEQMDVMHWNKANPGRIVEGHINMFIFRVRQIY